MTGRRRKYVHPGQKEWCICFTKNNKADIKKDYLYMLIIWLIKSRKMGENRKKLSIVACCLTSYIELLLSGPRLFCFWNWDMNYHQPFPCVRGLCMELQKKLNKNYYNLFIDIGWNAFTLHSIPHSNLIQDELHQDEMKNFDLNK